MPKLAELPESCIQKLGTQTDVSLAKRFRVSIDAVRNRRIRLGIQRFKDAYAKPEKKRPKKFIHILGTMSDPKVAKMFGMPVSLINRIRNSMNIAPFYKTKPGHPKSELRNKAAKLKKSGLTNSEIARELGVSRQRVSQWFKTQS
jgi:DNA invertase Pin-like site-specific DNA recombinase